MTEAKTIEKLSRDLEELHNQVKIIKENMLDPDMIATIDESELIDQSINELDEGKGTSHADLKKRTRLSLEKA